MEQTLENYPTTASLVAVAAVTKEDAAEIIQNDVNQTLAAVLLFLQTAMADEDLSANMHLQLAERNLKTSVKKLVQLHYSLLK